MQGGLRGQGELPSKADRQLENPHAGVTSVAPVTDPPRLRETPDIVLPEAFRARILADSRRDAGRDEYALDLLRRRA